MIFRMNKMFSFILIIVFLPLTISASMSERIAVLSSTPYETILEIKFPLVQEKDINSNSFRMGSLETVIRKDYPPVPYVAGIIAVSDRGGYTGEILKTDEYSVKLDNPINLAEKTYPEQQLALDTPQILRDFRILRFTFFPLRYNSETNELSVAKRAIISIRRTRAKGENEKLPARNTISRSFYPVYKSSILNFKFLKRPVSSDILLLLITPDYYYDYMLPFVEWKEKTGMMTKMVKFSEIGSNPTADDIRAYILNAYISWPHPPDYFLAVGDAGIFPTKYTVDYASYGTYVNDNYFVALDGPNDIFPDILGARLPQQNSFELQTMINKIINYESSPYMAETTWYNRAVMIASDEYPSQPATKRWVGDRFLDYGYEHIDSIYARNYTNAYSMRVHITTAINEGRGFLNYRGPGWDSGWAANFGWFFTISNVQTLNNGRKLPVVTSIGCGVAKFDEYNCFAEQWLRNGTPTSEKGAVSFFGPTWITHTRHNNKMDRGIYKGILQENLISLGEVALRGKLNMYEICGMNDTTVTEMNEYLVLGDPTLLLKTRVPESIFVSHPSFVPLCQSIPFRVTVNDAKGPVPGAFVCAKMDTVFHTSGITDSSGILTLTIFPTQVDTIFVSVVAQNHFFYQGFCLVKTSGPWLEYCKHFIDDDTVGTSNGNADSIPNPGEHIELPLFIKNYGDEQATSVYSLLTSNDTNIVITDSLQTFGNINSGDSALCQANYDITISTSTPDNHSIFFELRTGDVNDSIWTSHFRLTVSAPKIAFLKYTINDSGQTNPNGIIDPGEDAELICRLKNAGSAEAKNLTAILHSMNSFVHITDSSSTYGNILPNQQKEGTPFRIHADSLTPNGSIAEMKLTFTTPSGYRDSSTFNIIVGMQTDFLIWDPDLNHSSGPAIETALESNGYQGEYTLSINDFLGMLNSFKAIFICLGINPNNYILADGQLVDSLCSFLGEGGRLYMEGGETWSFDVPTILHPYFKIPELYDGFDDTYSISGRSGTFTNQMNFTYSGENNFMDRLDITGGSFIIFRNLSPYYNNGVAYDAGYYKTVGMSFEFGGLQDGTPPSTKKALADSIMHFFGITGIDENSKKQKYPELFSLSKNHPNPFLDRTVFDYTVPFQEHNKSLKTNRIKLFIFDVTGRKIRTIFDEKKSPGFYTALWDGKDDTGNKVCQGIYFVRLTLVEQRLHKTRKIILLK